jgi:hypothetical protein
MHQTEMNRASFKVYSFMYCGVHRKLYFSEDLECVTPTGRNSKMPSPKAPKRQPSRAEVMGVKSMAQAAGDSEGAQSDENPP